MHHPSHQRGATLQRVRKAGLCARVVPYVPPRQVVIAPSSPRRPLSVRCSGWRARWRAPPRRRPRASACAARLRGTVCALALPAPRAALRSWPRRRSAASTCGPTAKWAPRRVARARAPPERRARRRAPLRMRLACVLRRTCAAPLAPRWARAPRGQLHVRSVHAARLSGRSLRADAESYPPRLRPTAHAHALRRPHFSPPAASRRALSTAISLRC